MFLPLHTAVVKREDSGFRNRLGTLINVVGTRAKLADLFGVSKPAITGWMAGSEPTLTTYQKICERTGLDLDWISKGIGDEEAIIEKFTAWAKGRDTPEIDGARAALRDARERAKMSYSELAEKTHRDASFLRALEEGRAPLSETTAKLITKALPSLSLQELLEGSDNPRIYGEGVRGSYGAASPINLPPGVKGRYVPLLSLGQAGQWDAGHTDGFYDHTGVFALNVDDRKAFAVQVAGNSMEPAMRNGDLVVCSPAHPIANGDAGVIRTHSDQVFIKFWHRREDHVVLTSANKAFEPIKLPLAEIAGAWPIVQHIASGKIKRQL
jgi:phage repressor protein C with HTH and peptisase S24 domain